MGRIGEGGELRRILDCVVGMNGWEMLFTQELLFTRRKEKGVMGCWSHFLSDV